MTVVDYADPALPQRLRDFELRVADAFNEGRIRAPVHLAGGNEEQLISYFRYLWRPGDWVCTAWRSHYHCLLAGVDPERLFEDIIAGKSITLCYPGHRIISSAIVGGVLPIALGLALGVQKSGSTGRVQVHAFIGDMTARTGVYREVRDYASGHELPLSVVIEDNGKSVGTPTSDVWGAPIQGVRVQSRYRYELPWPHAGAGKWVRF